MSGIEKEKEKELLLARGITQIQTDVIMRDNETNRKINRHAKIIT